MSEPRYYLSIKAASIAFRAGINQVPLRIDLQGQGHSSDTPLNAWLHPESNELTVDLFWPPRVPFQPGVASFSADVFLADPASAAPKPGTIVASLVFPQKGAPETYPFRAKLPLRIENPMKTLLWKEADTLNELTDQDRAELVKAAETLRQQIVAKNSDECFELLRYKSRDLARADYHEDLQEIENIDRSQLAWMLKEDPVQVQPFTAAIAAFEIVAHKQVVHVFRKDGEAAIQFTSGRRPFGMSLYFSRMHGQWHIVR
jgi:hypothetical protein